MIGTETSKQVRPSSNDSAPKGGTATITNEKSVGGCPRCEWMVQLNR